MWSTERFPESFPQVPSAPRGAGAVLKRLVRVLPVVLASFVWVAAGSSLAAQADDEAEAASSAEDAPRLQVHGFLTQAYAVSDGEQVVGIPEGGTVDYRTAALQLRYRMSESGAFAVQLAHERLGKSPRGELDDEVELDWVFYRHRFGDYAEVKVGRVPIPRGLFNEILDVGTALPFYRPPLSVYGETSFASETLDGAVLSRSFFLGSGWLVDADVYYGGWEFNENDGSGFASAKVEDGVGFQVWVRSPVPGLRIGIAGQSFLVSEGVLRPPGDKERWDVWMVSGEWSGSRMVARAEYVDSRTDAAHYVGYYAQVGVRLTPRLTLNLQAERADLDFPLQGSLVDLRLDEDRAAGLSYAFSSSVVAKLEVHRNEGYAQVEEPAPSLLGPPAEVTYGIVSLSTSF